MLYFFLLLLTVFTPRSALAITPTPTPTPTPVVSPTGTGNLEEIQRIRELVSQKVAEKLKSINTGSSKRGIIGKIIQLDNTQITIEYRGVTRFASLDTTTTFIDLKRNKTTVGNIKIGTDALILGIAENDKFAAKRVVLIDIKSIEINQMVVLGKVVDISKASSTFSLIPIKNKNSEFQIKTDKNTQSLDKTLTKLSSPNLASGQKIICILSPNPKVTNSYTALKIINLDYSPSPTPTQKP